MENLMGHSKRNQILLKNHLKSKQTEIKVLNLRAK